MRRAPLRLLLLSLTLALWASACSKPGPEQALQDFFAALRAGDRDAVWGGFTSQSQQALTAYLARSAPPGSPPRPAAEVLVDSGLVRATREIVRVEVLTQSGGKAVLEVTDDQSEKQRFTLVLEEARWRIDLPVPKPGA